MSVVDLDRHAKLFAYKSEREREAIGEDDPHGWIQWKGTDVCMDLHCKCGAHLHVDTDFFYYFTCGRCGTVYAVGATVRLVELTDPDHIAEATSGCHQVVEDDDQ